LGLAWLGAAQRVNSASSSNEAAQDLPQKRRTLSSGFSQYQHDPLGGRLARAGAAADAVPEAAIETALGGSTVSPLSEKFSRVVSKIHPLIQQPEFRQDYFSGTPCA